MRVAHFDLPASHSGLAALASVIIITLSVNVLLIDYTTCHQSSKADVWRWRRVICVQNKRWTGHYRAACFQRTEVTSSERVQDFF